MNQLVIINIPQIVKKRVYEVDIKKLQKLLREKKKEKKLTINYISEELGVAKTKVEHFFRTDKYFDIPDPQSWAKLSELLNINDSELDKQITEFDFIDGNFEKSERHYFEKGIAPTILANFDEKIIVNTKAKTKVMNARFLGNIHREDFGTGYAGAVYDINYLCPALNTMQGGGRQPIIAEENKSKIMECHEKECLFDTKKNEKQNKTIRLGNIYNEELTGYDFGGNVWHINGIAPCLKTTAAASQQFLIIGVKKKLSDLRRINIYIVASRGRNPDNPSDRSKGIYLEQRFEINLQGISNCLTNVSKDNMVLEIYENNN